MNLLKTLATVSSMTLLSRILGFVRDFVIARTFGAGLLTDAFFVAFRLPNLLRRLFAEGAFSQAFVPVLGEYRNRRSADETRQLMDRVMSLLFLIVLVQVILGITTVLMSVPLHVALTHQGVAIILLAATVIMLSTAPAANAFLGVFMLAERTITKESARALATPGHADWCARQQPGYRKQWNNWRLPNGRVKYCASPYFTPLWMKRPN